MPVIGKKKEKYRSIDNRIFSTQPISPINERNNNAKIEKNSFNSYLPVDCHWTDNPFQLQLLLSVSHIAFFSNYLNPDWYNEDHLLRGTQHTACVSGKHTPYFKQSG